MLLLISDTKFKVELKSAMTQAELQLGVFSVSLSQQLLTLSLSPHKGVNPQRGQLNSAGMEPWRLSSQLEQPFVLRSCQSEVMPCYSKKVHDTTLTGENNVALSCVSRDKRNGTTRGRSIK